MSQGRSQVRLFLCFLLSLTLVIFLAQVSLSDSLSHSQPSTGSTQLIQQARERYQEGQFEAASQLWQQAAETFATQGDRLNQAMALSNLALSEQTLGQWREAQQAIATSLTLLHALDSDPVQQRILASTLDIQGQLYLALGQSGNALKTWQTAAEIYQAIRDRQGVKASQINQAQALQDLGLYPRACTLLLDTLELNNSACEISALDLQALPVGQSTPLQILGLRSLGNVLRVMGEAEQSQLVLEKSGYLAQQAKDSQQLGAIYLALGNTARALGNRKLSLKAPLTSPTFLSSESCMTDQTQHTASEFYQQAATCYRQAASESSSLSAIQSQLNLLSLAIQTQQVPAILTSLPILQSQIRSLPPSRATIFVHLKWAQNLLCLQAQQNPQNSRVVSPLLQSCSSFSLNPNILNPQKTTQVLPDISLTEIEQSLTSALQQAQALGDQQAEAMALGYLAAIAQQQGNIPKARQLTEQALQRLSARDNPELAYLWQWQLGRLYQLQNNPQAAIAAYTLAWQMLQSLRQDLVASNPDIQFTFRDRVEPVYRELVDLLLQPQNPSQAVLKQARDIIESLQLAELNNFFKEACLDTRPQQIEEIDPHAAVIYSIVLPERLAVIVSIPGQPLHHYSTLFTARQGGTQAVEVVYDSLLTSLNAYLFKANNALAPYQQFYNWLIRPIEADLANSNVKNLVFVLDGILRNIPIAALHDGQQYLIEKYTVALTPSLQLFNARQLALNRSAVLVGGLTEGRREFSALPGVKKEAQEIAAIAATEVLLDQEFTRANLESKIQSQRFPIVHLATHGQFSSLAEETYLLTWDERINVKKFDQILRTNKSSSQEGNNLYARSPIQLLVLSACQTAVGDKRAALGLAGLAVRSGAASTLATLWSVQDESTANFMTQFYSTLNQPNITKVEALRQAQLSLLRSPRYQDPFYWASFVLVGNWL